MCGISGFVSFYKVQEKHIKAIQKINESLFHRGPDAEGIYSNESVILGHRRLSIIDLSDKSNQPMHDKEKDISIVFNGEIYNYEEIRKELESEYEFQTDHSDTETIIYAYKKWGISCLNKFIGMFSIALFDKKENSVYLVRDRLGKKPLFYTENEEGLYFASESNALFSSGEIEKVVDDEAVYDYLSFLTVEAPKTFYKNIFKVPAGCYLKIKNKTKTLNNYWDVSEYLNKNAKLSEDEVIEKTRALLEKSMNYRNVSDVPIAIALSGGLDSCLNLAYSKMNTDENITTINVSYVKTSKFDESHIAKRFSNELGANFIAAKIDQYDYEKWILEYFEAQKDTPIGDPNSPLLYGISKIAAENGCKVLQVGEGGDEIGGYPVYSQLKKLDKFSRWVPQIFLKLALLVPLPSKVKRELEVLVEGGSVARRFLFGFTDMQKKRFWKKEVQESSLAKLSKYSNQITDEFNDSFLKKVLNIEYKVRLAELLLPRVDYPSMAASVEARSPFMDHSLIEYSAGVPFSQKMSQGPKTIIRKIASSILPEYILSQPKVGFGMLLNPFLNEELPVWFEKEILQSPSPLKEYIEEDFLVNLHREHLEKKAEGFRMWILFSLHKWLELNK